MPKRRSKDIGTAAETAVVRWLQANGWPHAERRALRGNQDAGDVTGTPGVCWEVKAGQAAINASDGQIADWLTEVIRETTHGHGEFGILIQRRRGKADPGNWWSWLPLIDLVRLADRCSTRPGGGLFTPDIGGAPCRLRLADLTNLLRDAGYGDPR